MKRLKKFTVLIAFAVLSLSGPSAWADSFIAKANLDRFNLVPPILGGLSGKITLTFRKPRPTEATIAKARPRPRNSYDGDLIRPGDLEGDFVVENIRLYFGQRFAHGQPIATLCDDAIDSLKCNFDNVELGDGKFSLSDIQFQPAQTTLDSSILDREGRLQENERGFGVIRDLIKRGLIYVVINSPYKAKVDPDTDLISGYKAPRCSFLPSVFCKRPKGKIISDGDLRGTLHLLKK